MAHEKIPYSAPGIAGFSSASFGGADEWLYSGDVDLTTDHVEVTNALGTPVELPFLGVVAYTPATKTMAMADQTDGPAYAVLPAPITIAAGATVTVPIYRSGYFEGAALVWDASFDTEAKKKFAFEGGVNQIYIGFKGFNNDSIVV